MFSISTYKVFFFQKGSEEDQVNIKEVEALLILGAPPGELISLAVNIQNEAMVALAIAFEAPHTRGILSRAAQGGGSFFREGTQMAKKAQMANENIVKMVLECYSTLFTRQDLENAAVYAATESIRQMIFVATKQLFPISDNERRGFFNEMREYISSLKQSLHTKDLNDIKSFIEEAVLDDPSLQLLLSHWDTLAEDQITENKSSEEEYIFDIGEEEYISSMQQVIYDMKVQLQTEDLNVIKSALQQQALENPEIEDLLQNWDELILNL